MNDNNTKTAEASPAVSPKKFGRRCCCGNRKCDTLRLAILEYFSQQQQSRHTKEDDEQQHRHVWTRGAQNSGLTIVVTKRPGHEICPEAMALRACIQRFFGLSKSLTRTKTIYIALIHWPEKLLESQVSRKAPFRSLQLAQDADNEMIEPGFTHGFADESNNMHKILTLLKGDFPADLIRDTYKQLYVQAPVYPYAMVLQRLESWTNTNYLSIQQSYHNLPLQQYQFQDSNQYVVKPSVAPNEAPAPQPILAASPLEKAALATTTTKFATSAAVAADKSSKPFPSTAHAAAVTEKGATTGSASISPPAATAAAAAAVPLGPTQTRAPPASAVPPPQLLFPDVAESPEEQRFLCNDSDPFTMSGVSIDTLYSQSCTVYVIQRTCMELEYNVERLRESQRLATALVLLVHSNCGTWVKLWNGSSLCLCAYFGKNRRETAGGANNKKDSSKKCEQFIICHRGKSDDRAVYCSGCSYIDKAEEQRDRRKRSKQEALFNKNNAASAAATNKIDAGGNNVTRESASATDPTIVNEDGNNRTTAKDENKSEDSTVVQRKRPFPWL